jgi:predicted CXXCH cytochrome family protein
VDFVVGGARMKMLLTTMPDGRLQVLPSMKEEPGPWFDYTHLMFGGPVPDPAKPPVIAPGEPSFWTGPDRNYNSRCARCHSSGYEPALPAPGDGGPRGTVRAHGVDCEACHGDGAAHAARHRGGPGAPAAAPLPRLAALGRDRDLAACLLCHMEGEVVRRGFRPGDDVFDFVEPTLLDMEDRADAEGRPRQLIYEGLSFLAGACATAGGLTCLTCHDPHASPNPAQLRFPRDRTDSLCARCHAALVEDPAAHSRHSSSGSGARCIACHMAPMTVERGHGNVHDHGIGIPRPGAAGDVPSRDACTWCHDGGRAAPGDAPRLGPEALRAAVDRWWPAAKPPRAWTLAIRAAREEQPRAVALLEGILRDRAVPRVARASAARLLGRYPADAEARLHVLSAATDADVLVRGGATTALAAFPGPEANAALLRALGDASPAVRAAAARAALGGWDRVRRDRALLAAVLPALEEDARAVPDDHRRWFRLGAARSLAGDVKGAVEAYERKLLLDPGARLVREQCERLRARLPK